MRYSKDQIILRDGQAAAGKVMDNEFEISTSFGKILLKKNKIIHIHFMRPDGTSYPPTDEIKTNNGDDINGKIVKPKSITFILASNGQKLKINRDKISTLIFLESLDHNTKSYPQLS